MPRSRKTVRILYLGLELPPPPRPENERWVHHPLIRVVPRTHDAISFEIVRNHLNDYTHIIFTSKTSVRLFADLIAPKKVFANVIAVGKSTAQEVNKLHWPKPFTPDVETAEGIVDLLNTLDLSQAFVLWPHSALSRPVLFDYFQERNIRLHHPVLYDTEKSLPEKMVDLQKFDGVFFTSPSTVDAFFEIYGRPPSHLQLRTIGTVTENYLHSRLAKF
jgi:uroporphyrinogen-III synthase